MNSPFAMLRLLLTSFLALTGTIVFAQKNDSLFVANNSDGWYLTRKVQPGETVFSVARRYHVPPAMLADANGVSYKGDLTGVSVVKVPLGAYNQAPTPVNINESRPVYYRVNTDDNLYRISKRAGVQQYRLQELNHLTDNNEVRPGKVLLVGYILYDATELPVVTNPKVPAAAANRNATVNTAAKPVIINGNTGQPVVTQDTFKAAVDTGMSKGEQLYLEQTNNGQNVTVEKGPAAFFPMSSTVKDVYLAFHNTIPKGTIVKVHNPGNDKDIYVKIIGQLPANKKFYNTIIGISNRARAELGTVEQRLWVELSYAGY